MYFDHVHSSPNSFQIYPLYLYPLIYLVLSLIPVPPIKGNLCGILFAGVGLTPKVDYIIKESSLSFYHQLPNVSRCSARCETHTSAPHAGILYGLSAYKFCVCCLNSYEFICMTVLLCLENIVSL